MQKKVPAFHDVWHTSSGTGEINNVGSFGVGGEGEGSSWTLLEEQDWEISVVCFLLFLLCCVRLFIGGGVLPILWWT